MKHLSLLVAPLAFVTTSVLALEYPIGDPVMKNGMEIAAVYLQPVVMDPAGKLPAEKADIHLEADIHALENNANGFPIDAWIPYLEIDYVLSKDESDATIEGTFMPMVASDGTHYGDNVKLDGPGKYQVTFTIQAPQLMRHIDKETGVAKWFDTFSVNYEFVYAGVGKKGGY